MAEKKTSTKKKASPAAKKSSGTKSEPASPKGTFEDLIAMYPPIVQYIASRLRAIVYEELPDAEEAVWTGGWRMSLYKDISEICGIGPVKDYVNFYLTRGVDIPDPDGLMEGKGKGIRHVKVRSPDDIPEESIRNFIREGKKLVMMKQSRR